MRLSIICILTMLTLLFSPCSGSCNDYYVRTDGSDTNCNGSADVAASAGLSPNCAYATIGKAESVLTTGTHTVHIAAGNYPEQVTVNVSGTSTSNRITFIGTGTVTVRAIKLTSADYITLNNLTIGWTGNSYPWSAHLIIDGGSDYAIITGCIVNGGNVSGIDGVSIYGNNGLLTGTKITGIKDATCVELGNLSGTAPGTTGVTATNNLITDNVSTDAFRIHGSNLTISYNEIRNNVYPGEGNHPDVFQWFPNDNNCANSYSIRNVTIEGNYAHDMESQLYFGNNVCYASGTVVENIVFRNNVFYNVGFMGQTYSTDPMTNISFYNNVFHKVGHKYYLYGTQRSYATHAISASSGVTRSEVKNNIFLECGDEPAINSQGFYSFGSGYTISNNYVAGPSYAPKGTAYFRESIPPSISGGDPKFIDEAGHDYRLQSSSPLIDRGVSISSFNTDRDGVSRPEPWDIGAYEHNGSVISTPKNLQIKLGN